MNTNPVVIHLDQKDFINLARAQHARSGGERCVGALNAAKHAVLSNSAVFPLSSSHYVETSKNHNSRQRRELARVMGPLSRFRTMSPPRPVIEAELEHALHHLTGLPEQPKPIEVFGVGMSHAVGLPSSSKEIWRENGHDEDAYDALVVEQFLLETPDGPTIYDEERRAGAIAYAEAEERRAAALARSSTPDAIRSVIFDLVGLWDFRDILIAAQANAGLPIDFIPKLQREDLETFLLNVPTLHVIAELRRLGHENPQKRWDSHDMQDLRSLAVALVYCDAVFCDKRWCHEIGRTALAEHHWTKVYRRTQELEEILVRSRTPDSRTSS